MCSYYVFLAHSVTLKFYYNEDKWETEDNISHFINQQRPQFYTP